MYALTVVALVATAQVGITPTPTLMPVVVIPVDTVPTSTLAIIASIVIPLITLATFALTKWAEYRNKLAQAKIDANSRASVLAAAVTKAETYAIERAAIAKIEFDKLKVESDATIAKNASDALIIRQGNEAQAHIDATTAAQNVSQNISDVLNKRYMEMVDHQGQDIVTLRTQGDKDRDVSSRLASDLFEAQKTILRLEGKIVELTNQISVSDVQSRGQIVVQEHMINKLEAALAMATDQIRISRETYVARIVVMEATIARLVKELADNPNVLSPDTSTPGQRPIERNHGGQQRGELPGNK